VRSVDPVSRFVSDWCRVRGSRESTARAARCVPLRPGGHVTRSPAEEVGPHTPRVRAADRPCVLCSARGTDSVGRACGPYRTGVERERRRKRERREDRRGGAGDLRGEQKREAIRTMRRKLGRVREKMQEGGEEEREQERVCACVCV